MPKLCCARFLISVLLPLLLSAGSLQAAPTIGKLDIHGLQVGQTTTLTITGRDLLPAPQIRMALPIADQKVRPKATPKRVQIDVRLAEGITPGLYNLWLATTEGVSQRVVVAVDGLPEQKVGEPIKSLPVAVHGRLAGSETQEITFPGEAGQRILCEVESRRLGGKLRPVLHVEDPAGKHLAWTLPSHTLRGDARLQVTLPEDGTYTLRLHDLEYAASAPNHFRLKIGRWQYADLVFPPAVERGTKTTLELLGNGSGEPSISFQASGSRQRVPISWNEPSRSSGMRPGVILSNRREMREEAAKKTPTEIAAGAIGINGRLSAPDEEDTFPLTVQEGQKLRFRVMASRLGSPVDSVLELRRENGKRVARNDDTDGSPDSQLDYTVPKKVDSLIVAVRDALHRGGRNCIYRLLVDPAEQQRPDFTLRSSRRRVNVAHQDRRIFEVEVDRQGYQGPIELDFAKLPDGFAMHGGTIPAGGSGALISLEGQSSKPSTQLTHLRGRSTGSESPMERTVQAGGEEADALPPWLNRQMALALTPPPKTKFTADWVEPDPKEKLVPGSKLTATLQFDRSLGDFGAVRFYLVTSQKVPERRGRPDRRQALRRNSGQFTEVAIDGKARSAYQKLQAARKKLEKARSEAAKLDKKAPQKQKEAAKKKVKQAEKAVQAARKAAIEATQKAKKQGRFTIVIPGNLPAVPYDVAFRAELLSANKKTVVAETFTPIRRFAVMPPIAVKLDGPDEITSRLDPQAGAQVELTGSVQRRAGMKGKVTVSVEGLPSGIKAPKTVVKAEETAFKLPLKFPANFNPGVYKGIRLFATGKYDANDRFASRSQDVPLAIRLRPAPKGEDDKESEKKK